MRKLLVVLASMALILGLALPTMAASLKVSGTYEFTAAYENGELETADGTKTTNFFDFSTLKLTLDYGEGDSLMVAHLPLKLTAATVVASDGSSSNPVKVALADKYWFAFNGDPLKLSLSNVDPKSDSPYAFQSFGDPLGLVKTVDGATHTFKAVGTPFGVGVTGYVVDYNKDDSTTPDDAGQYKDGADIEYELLRLTYGLPGGYTLGAIYGLEATANNPVGTRETGSQLAAQDETYIRNLALDLTGPLPVSEKATLTAAAARSQKKITGGDWTDDANAFLLSVKDINLGAFTVAGDIRAVDKQFEAVAPDADTSDVKTFSGQKQFKGSVSTPLNLGGKEVTLTVTDDYRTNYDVNYPAIDPSNQVTAEAVFKPTEKVTTTVGGSYKSYFDDVNAIPDNDEGDYTRSVYGKVEYKMSDAIKVTGEARHTGAEKLAVEGSGVKLSGSVEATPIPGVKANADASYATGEYDFANSVPLAETQTRTTGHLYVEAKQSFQPGSVKGVDVVLASGASLDSTRGPYIVGYGEGKVNLDDRLSTKTALLYGKTEDHTDLTKILYTGVDYNLSTNSTVSVGYSNKNDVGNIYAAYKVKLGASTMTVSYGETRLGDPCTGDYDKDKPWAWLCTISGEGTRYGFYKLSVSIPF
ncbi:MAG: hypothetical protein HPY52_04710 [Firmicutes bacterium]|nr:hypothetical protein [Bacillota bacterium]